MEQAHADDEGAGRCAFCSEALRGVDEVGCARCEARFHRRCWETFQRCATYGCASRSYVALADAAANPRPVAAPAAPPTEPSVEFDRSNVLLYLLLASSGMVLALACSFLLVVLLGWFGFMGRTFLPDLLGPKWPELLLLVSAFGGGLLAALPARERLRFDFARGKLTATITWSSLRLLSFDLRDLDEIKGFAVEEQDGRLWAWFVSAPSLARRAEGGHARSFLEYLASDAHAFMERTLLSMGPPAGDQAAVTAWLGQLEGLAAAMDRSLLLPARHACLTLLPAPPRAVRALPPADAPKEKT